MDAEKIIKLNAYTHIKIDPLSRYGTDFPEYNDLNASKMYNKVTDIYALNLCKNNKCEPIGTCNKNIRLSDYKNIRLSVYYDDFLNNIGSTYRNMRGIVLYKIKKRNGFYL